MTACVFVGPSLSIAAARDVLGAIYLPPAGHGDIYRATLRRPKPRAIGLIDGYFRHRPAVRHKEILWAMSAGIPVFGAASIGALRAAELSDFGMVGIGRIFADFCSGRLEDDDEVAVDHGPAEMGYLPVNEALVDIRATLEMARQQGVIGPECEALLVTTAKQRFYVQRTYSALFESAALQGAAPAELDRLCAWLPAGRISRKRDDALALLGALRDFLASDQPPLAVKYRFERTEAWDADIAFAAPLSMATERGAALRREHLLDEMRLWSEAQAGLRNEALGLALARREAERSRITLSQGEIEAFRQCWLSCHDLHKPAVLAAWRRENHLDGEAFDDFITVLARGSKVATIARDLVDDSMPNALRARGGYAALAARALEKQRALAAAGAADVSLAESGVSAFALLAWFCQERLQRPVPTDVELFAAEFSFPSAEALYRALLRERLYLQLTGPNNSSKPT